MNSRQINLVLGAVVIGLLGTIFFMVSWAKDRQIPEVIDRTNFVANTVTQITVKKFNATNLLSALANRMLNWNAIESTNYYFYMLNLRSIGCPEETIRDIIIADVAKLYARKRDEILSEAPLPEYWRTVGVGEDLRDPATREQLRALEEEKRQLVGELLGVSYDSELAKFDADLEPLSRLHGVFPAETRRQIQGVLDAYDRMEEEIRFRTGGLLLPQEESQLRDLALERQEALRQILTPEQMQTFELYMSPLAEEMRRDLHGFQPSAEEFAEIFELRRSFEDVIGLTFSGEYEVGPRLREQAMAEAEATLQGEIESILGADRFAEYEKITDPSYQQLVQLNERLSMPEGVVDRVYAVKNSAELQRERILGNQNLTLEQRQRAIAAISQAVENALSEAMGEELFSTYRRVGSDWLAGLGELPPEDAQLAPEVSVSDITPPLPQTEGPRIGDPVPPGAPFPFYQPPIVPPPPPLPNPVPQ
jgi:hypothetical protein